MLLDKATGANGIMQEKYITITVAKKDIKEAHAYFARVGADLTSHFAALGSKCVELTAADRLRILYDFYRADEEGDFHFDARDMMRKDLDFRDYICPDSIEKNSDYLKLGEKYCRVLFLKGYASYIKDSINHMPISAFFGQDPLFFHYNTFFYVNTPWIPLTISIFDVIISLSNIEHRYFGRRRRHGSGKIPDTH